MAKKYVVDLSEEERDSLRQLVRRGKARVRRINRARILLLADRDRTDEEIAQALQLGRSTVERTRKRFVEEGLEPALSERPRLGKARLLTNTRISHLITASPCHVRVERPSCEGDPEPAKKAFRVVIRSGTFQPAKVGHYNRRLQLMRAKTAPCGLEIASAYASSHSQRRELPHRS